MMCKDIAREKEWSGDDRRQKAEDDLEMTRRRQKVIDHLQDYDLPTLETSHFNKLELNNVKHIEILFCNK